MVCDAHITGVASSPRAEGAPARTDAIDAISGSPERVTEVCETFKHALKHHEQLSKVQDALQSAFASELDATFRDGVDLSDPAAYRSHRNVLEIYAFLLAWFVQVAEQQANAELGAAGTTKKKVRLSRCASLRVRVSRRVVSCRCG